MAHPTETIPDMPFDETDRSTWPELLTVAQAAAIWGVSEDTIRAAAVGEDARLRIVQLSKRSSRVTKASLLRLIDGESPPDAPPEE